MGQIENTAKQRPKRQGGQRAGRVEDTDEALGGTEIAEVTRDMNEQRERELLEDRCREESGEVSAESVGGRENPGKLTVARRGAHFALQGWGGVWVPVASAVIV